MNERIQELALQARIKDHWSIDEGRYLTNYLDEQKFAELIVRECARIAWEDSAQYATFVTDPIMNGKADVLALCSHHIKEHFGVEE